ncbi:hypothetical protein ASA1KI_05780 [Opitutales bacterium ASA1]|uniref:hypothetical protein n=1 Tax=Congregicoccus parvus TaxID=3081749 RepID=UPI002B28EB20|nr:hypothetical protein ASA1KI_05780 [Opitutales bacterium ASA1]
MIARLLPFLVSVCLAVEPCSAPLRAQQVDTPENLLLALAGEPAEVRTTAADRTFRGLLDGIHDSRLRIRLARDGGEIVYSFSRDEIARLVLPGIETETRALESWDRGDAAAALPLLDALGRQRVRYLPFLDEAQRRPVVTLVEAHEQVGDPHAAIGFARRLETVELSARERNRLRDAVLRAHARLDHGAELVRLAEAWCAEADPDGPSALGWSILARHALVTGEPERALWVALQPIVFSDHRPKTALDVCYAVAVAASDALADAPHARTLAAEMRLRGLAWPHDPLFASMSSQYSEDATDTVGTGARPPTTATSRSIVIPPPPADAAPRPRGMDDVRKLVRSVAR